MRIKRTVQKYRERTKTIGIIVNLCILIPIAAIITSIAVISIYNGNLDLLHNNNKANNSELAFNYLIGKKSLKLYRVEISRHEVYEEAVKAVDFIKEKKLNAFILKENGFVVMFGVFTKVEDAKKAKKKLDAEEINNAIIEINTVSNTITSNSIIYHNEDNDFIDSAKRVDTVVLELLDLKSELSIYMLEKPEIQNTELLEKILDKEKQLENYGHMFEVSIKDKTIDILKHKYAILLKEFLKYRIELDDVKNYYYIQNSLLNQMELIEKFKRELNLQ